MLFHRLIQAVTPPGRWVVAVVVALGVLCGILLLTLRISNAMSYLSDDPRVCVNCHVMSPQYATWQHSSHGRSVTCNDCHVPQDNVVRKYAFKASDGMRHSYMFTFRLEPQVIRIKEAGKMAVQENCIRCHTPLVDRVLGGGLLTVQSRHGGEALCWSCHRETPHGRVNSLASAPYARVPRLSSVMPEWISSYVNRHQ